jgi:tetratricopeptide (TPR) repeat protein
MKRRLCLTAALACLALLAPLPGHGHADLLLLVEELSKDIEKDPKNAELYMRRGELYRSHMDFDQASADYDAAQRLNPAFDAVDLARGRLHLEAGWPLSAKAWLDRYLVKFPKDPGALTARAQALTRLQLRLEASRDYTMAIALSPDPGPELFIERAQALSNEGPEYIAEALHALDEGVKRLGQLVTLQLLAIDLELKQKNFDGALSRLDKVAEKSPRKESWLVRRGEILIQADRLEEAKKAFQSALAALESLPPTRRNVPAMLELQRRIRTEVEKLNGPGTAGTKAL